MGGHKKSITKAQKLILLGGGIQCLPPTEKGLIHRYLYKLIPENYFMSKEKSQFHIFLYIPIVQMV